MDATAKKITAARAALVLDEPFFGVLALRLKIVADPSCKTAWVDGVTLGYNPSFVDSLPPAKLKALLAHEVMHCACGHPWRRGSRESKRWNGACDHAINPILDKAKFDLPEGALLDPAYEGKASEWIYDRMPQSREGDGDKQGEPSPGDPQGEVRDTPADAAQEDATEAEWAAAVQQAANAAAAAGKLPGALERFASDAAKPKVDWRSALRRFAQEVTRSDYTWTRPNRRYVAQGFYLPALHSQSMGSMVVALDISGSIDGVTLSQFNAEVQAIADEMRPERVYVIHCDAEVRRIDTFERDDPIEMSPAPGGGGTKFGPVFDAVEELDTQPACIVYLTDLAPWGENGWPAVEPAVPTLWATTVERPAPFGEVLPIT